MAKKNETNKTWIVTTSPARPIKDIAKDLTEAGFTVVNVNDEIQSITGAARGDSVEQLRRVPGVVDVSPDEPREGSPTIDPTKATAVALSPTAQPPTVALTS